MHSYQYDRSFAAKARSLGFGVLASMPGKAGALTESQRRAVEEAAREAPLDWWDLPEERRSWRSKEWSIIEEYVVEIRKVDPQDRPTYMYLPGHYSEEAVRAWVPALDVLPASIYPHHHRKPHSWVRWRMESVVAAIHAAGAGVGRNHRRGEKWPVAVLELFGETKRAAGCRHDFWQSLASGARGILVYGYAYRDATPELSACWREYDSSARLLRSEPELESVIIEGRWKDVEVAQVGGLPRVPAYPSEPRGEAPISFPSVRAVGAMTGGSAFLLVINSSTDEVVVEIPSAPCAGEHAVLGDPDLPIASTSGRLRLPGLAVRLSSVDCAD